MRFKFVGSGDNDPEEITMYGVTFKLNGPAKEVPTDLEGKFSGNAHFKAMNRGKNKQ